MNTRYIVHKHDLKLNNCKIQLFVLTIIHIYIYSFTICVSDHRLKMTRRRRLDIGARLLIGQPHLLIDELNQVTTTGSENANDPPTDKIHKRCEKKGGKKRAAHFNDPNYTKILMILIALQAGVAECQFSKYISATTQIQAGKDVYIFKEYPIVYRINIEPYWADLITLKEKVNLIVKKTPGESFKKHIIILGNNENIVIFKNYVNEETCPVLCESVDLKPLSLENAQKLNSISDECKMINLQMTISVNKWGLICVTESSTMDEICFNKLVKSARKGNLMFYQNIQEFKNTMLKGKSYTLVQNTTHLFATQQHACCSCFGSDSNNNREELITSIYLRHQNKMRAAALERVHRIESGINELEKLLENLSFNHFQPTGILEVDNNEVLISNIKENYPTFFQTKKNQEGIEKYSGNVLYTRLVNLWNQISINNTDEELFNDMLKIEYETLNEEFLAYIYKTLQNINFRLIRKIETINPSSGSIQKTIPILYRKGTTLEDVIYKFDEYVKDLTLYDIIHLLRYIESEKLSLVTDFKRLCNIRLKYIPYFTKPITKIEDTKDLQVNTVYPGNLNLPSIWTPNDQTTDELVNSDAKELKKKERKKRKRQNKNRSEDRRDMKSLIAEYIRQNRGDFPENFEENLTPRLNTWQNTLSSNQNNNLPKPENVNTGYVRDQVPFIPDQQSGRRLLSSGTPPSPRRAPTQPPSQRRVPTRPPSPRRVPTQTTLQRRVPTRPLSPRRTPTQSSTQRRIPTQPPSRRRIPTQLPMPRKPPTQSSQQRVPTYVPSNTVTTHWGRYPHPALNNKDNNNQINSRISQGNDRDRLLARPSLQYMMSEPEISLSEEGAQILTALLNLAERFKNEINVDNIDDTDYIRKRMTNRDTNNDNFLDELELSNYIALIDALGVYDSSVMKAIILNFGKTKYGHLSLKEFYFLTKLLEKIRKQRRESDLPGTTTSPSPPRPTNTGTGSTSPIPEKDTSLLQDIESESEENIENNIYTPAAPEELIPTSYAAPEMNEEDLYEYTTATTNENDEIYTPAIISGDILSNNKGQDQVPNNLETTTQTTSTTPSTVFTTDHMTTPTERNKNNLNLNEIDFDLTIPDDYQNANLRKRRSISQAQISTKRMIETHYPEIFSMYNDHKRVKRNIITPLMSYLTGLASKEAIKDIAKHEKSIQENENLFKERIINLTSSDNIFRSEIKNISLHIAELLGQSTDLSTSFLEMMKEETSIEKRVNFIIKSLGQVVRLSINIENLIFHLTSLQEEIEVHLLNVYAIQTGTSILNEELFHDIEKQGGIMSHAVFSNVKYDVIFQSGVFNIEAKYKIIVQKFRQYKFITLPYVIRHEGEDSTIMKLDVMSEIIINEEQEVIENDDLAICESENNNIFCPIKHSRFTRSYKTCEAQLIARIMYGQPNELNLCNDRITFLQHMTHRQEYLQTNKYILIISEFQDTGFWICEDRDEEPDNIPPLRITWIEIKEGCILKTSVYRIYIYKAESTEILDKDFYYTTQDLISNLILPLFEQYNFTEDFEEISNNIIQATTRIKDEKTSITDLIKQEADLHHNDLGRLILQPWKVSEGTSEMSSAAVVSVWGINVIILITCCCCCYFYCGKIVPIIKCCCLPFESLVKLAKTQNKKAALENLEKSKTDFYASSQMSDELATWINKYGEGLRQKDFAFDPVYKIIFHAGRSGDRLYFGLNEQLLVLDKLNGTGLKEIGKMSTIPYRIRRRLKDILKIVETEMGTKEDDIPVIPRPKPIITPRRPTAKKPTDMYKEMSFADLRNVQDDVYN